MKKKSLVTLRACLESDYEATRILCNGVGGKSSRWDKHSDKTGRLSVKSQNLRSELRETQKTKKIEEWTTNKILSIMKRFQTYSITLSSS